jgi:hypothetical protein
MTELELKARAYDLIAQIQACQAELQRVNEALAQRAVEEKKEEK